MFALTSLFMCTNSAQNKSSVYLCFQLNAFWTGVILHTIYPVGREKKIVTK